MKAATIALMTIASAAILSAQPQPAPQQQRPAQGGSKELKNVLVLKDLPPAELIRNMRFISASLGVSCDFCHVFGPGDTRDFASDDKEEKRTARNMIRLVIDTNTNFFKGHTAVSCNTCHRGSSHPMSVPMLPVAAPQPMHQHEEHEADEAAGHKPVMPTRDELVSRYARAIGNVDQKAISSIELKGTRQASEHPAAPIDVVVSKGNTRVTATTQDGEMVSVVTPNGGWARDEHGTHAMPPMQLEFTREVLDALRPTFPAGIPAEGRVMKAHINDKDVWVLTTPAGTNGRQRFYFDPETGLLLRRQTLTYEPVGAIPQQTDFDDYRDVGGFKLPFRVDYESVDRGASRSLQYTEIVPNAKVDQKVFVQPE